MTISKSIRPIYSKGRVDVREDERAGFVIVQPMIMVVDNEETLSRY